MTDDRPDPDALLAHVQAEEAKQTRGKLKIFFGAAPGVGKTYAMLEAGRKEGKAGADVVVGYIEPHVRPDTQALILGLDLLPRRQVEYRGERRVLFTLQEADVRLVIPLLNPNSSWERPVSSGFLGGHARRRAPALHWNC